VKEKGAIISTTWREKYKRIDEKTRRSVGVLKTRAAAIGRWAWRQCGRRRDKKVAEKKFRQREKMGTRQREPRGKQEKILVLKRNNWKRIEAGHSLIRNEKNKKGCSVPSREGHEEGQIMS